MFRDEKYTGLNSYNPQFFRTAVLHESDLPKYFLGVRERLSQRKTPSEKENLIHSMAAPPQSDD